MIINWQGLSSFKIRSGNTLLLIDPLLRSSYEIKSSIGKFDIALLSSPFLDYDDKELAKCPYVFRGPGEYDAHDIAIQIAPSIGPDNHKNNIFSISWEGLKLVHLGALAQKGSITKFLEKINGIDILMIPIGGKRVISASDAIELIHQIEPSIVIPMLYGVEKTKNKLDLDSSEYFIQEMGQDHEELDKLNINKSSINKDKTKLIILKPS